MTLTASAADKTSRPATGKIDILKAIVLREMRVRFAGRQLGYLWAVFEPLAHIAVFTLLFHFLDRQSPVEEPRAIFFASGILPWLLFARLVARVSQAASSNLALLVYPHIYPVDFMLSRIIIESATFLLSSLILALFAWMTTDFVIEDPLQALLAWTAMTVMGGGVGVLLALAQTYVASTMNVYTMVQRLLYFASGIFFLVSDLPATAQEILFWNPVLHGIEWFRSATLPSYDSTFAQPDLFSLLGLSLLAIGLMGERFRRRELRTP